MSDIPPGFAQANHVLRLAGDNEDMIVTMGVDLDTITFLETPAIAFQLREVFWEHWAPLLSNAYSLVRVDLYANFAGERTITSSVAPIAQFQNTNAALPQNCAYLVKKLTALGGRSNRGRCYVPGVPEGTVNNAGQIDSGVQGTVQNAATAWLNDINAIVGINQAVVLHSVGSFLEPAPITGLSVDGKIATQRRRLR